jgi:hypothetical protein
MKTSDLIGKALDQAVGVCKKWDVRVAESGNVYVIAKTSGNIHDCVPSSNWTQGGPIIEQEKIEIKPVYSGWAAYLGNTYFGIGDTALIAAMRCYVASKMDDSVLEKLKWA